MEAEINSDLRAYQFFLEDPEAAMQGERLSSAESSPDIDRSSAILELAHNHPERFIELVSKLSPVIQDIFFQYYLLGRTYAQIGAILFPEAGPHGNYVRVRRGNSIGISALCAVIAFNGPPPARTKKKALAKAYRDMLKFNFATRTVQAKAPKSFGFYEVTPNGDLGELFSPSWSVLKRNS